MADDQEAKPLAGPMAFTIDFGTSGTEVKTKKLGLKDDIGRFVPPKLKLKSSPDEENGVDNATNEENNVKVKSAASSEAGTYTIDNEDENAQVKGDDFREEDEKKINIAFGVEDEKVTSREWVSMWASNSFMDGSPQKPLDDVEDYSDDLGGRPSSSQRRRLPPTPLRSAGSNGPASMTYGVNDFKQDSLESRDQGSDANEYLKDTISLMTALEARISSDEPKTKAPPTPPRRRPIRPDLGLKGSSAAAKAKEAKEKATAQWQRRKNYDPLKSMAQSRSKLQTTNSYTDDSSEDVESYTSLKVLPNQRVAMIRNDGGRHSLRQKAEPLTTRKPSTTSGHFRNVTRTQNGRSTSSLSSKELEFQAWKRRKNYNPLRSAASATRPSSSSSATPTRNGISSSKKPINVSNSTSIRSTIKTSSTTTTSEMLLSEQKRSASFHYPDGTSRITHNVYSSEDDFNEDEEDVEPRLYEVNEDELFLAYDSGGVVAPRRSPARSSASSGSKLEALDNLVISTIFSVSTKLCMLSSKLVQSVQERTEDKEDEAMLQTLLYVLEDVDPPVSPSKKTSRELAGTLRNLKKVEQALQTIERSDF